MVVFENVARELLDSLGEILLASGSRVAVTDGTYTLVRNAASAEIVPAAEGPEAQVSVQDLYASFSRAGLDPEQAGDRAVFWGFRNVLAREDRGEPWAPQMLRKILRKTYHAVGTPEPQTSVQHLLIAAGPDQLKIQSVADIPPKVLHIRLDRDAFRQLLAGNPGSSEWRAWVRSDAVQFSQEPLWLKLALKLL